MHQLDSAINSDGEVFEGRGGHSVYWYYDNEVAGPPVLFIHSINAAPSAMELKPLFEHFRQRRPVFAPDLPGFGRSSRNVGSFTSFDFANEIAGIVDRLPSQEPPDIVALSLSCEFVARAVVDLGVRARSLTFISPSGFSMRPPPSPKAQGRLKRVFEFAGFGRNVYKLLRTERSVRYFYGQNFSGSIPDELIAYAVKTMRVEGAYRMPLQFLSMGLFTSDAVGELYRRLDTPVMVLFDQDPNVSFERFEEFESNPNWHFERIAPSRGLPHWEHPESTADALAHFFAQL